MAAHLQLRAANAHLDASDPETCLSAAAIALEQGVQHTHRRRIVWKFARLVGRLRDGGHESASDALEQSAREGLGVQKLRGPAGDVTVNRRMRRNLPKSCPTCGVPVEATRIEFDEDGAAECESCGVVLVGGTE